ncbi:hypothetical protein LTR62_007866 [Meristemomyces frigidus]|uniref:Uncharacterized protein n=1 Tax=Meristemomyces frigidus TaxID=1508187 RepID=A0AAN7TBD0_9PEZI|nr:hypothetical protein LTR62_007866 [Meristemomyces frigidus]
MAPPHKRRKVEDTPQLGDMQYVTDDTTYVRPASVATHPHHLEHTSQLHWNAGPQQVPQHIEEIHLKILQQAKSTPDSYGVFDKRQAGTGVSSSSSAEKTLSVTVVAAVAADGSTTSLATATASVSGDTSFATTATVASVQSPYSSLASSAILSSSGTVIASAGSSSENSTQSSSGSSSIATSSGTAGTQSGFIGRTQGSPSGTASGSASSNSTSTIASSQASITGTIFSPSDISSNLTTSALIFVSNGHAITSKTTIDRDSSTTTSASSHSSETASSTTLGAAFYFLTLGDGTVETVSRSTDAYATTFANGDQTTIPAATGSYLTSTDRDGSTFTSYQASSPSATNAGAQSTTNSPQGVGAGVNGPGGTSTTSATSSTSSAASNSGGNNTNNNTAPPGTIAGGVVGGAAGLAVILLIAMLFLRWYRRRSQLGHQALPPNAGLSPTNDQVSRPRGPGMAERAGLLPALGAVPAIFRHHNRSSEAASSAPTERGFERVAGRKMPSQYSPGMSSTFSPPPPTMPLQDSGGNMSTTSFYRDSTGFYGGEGTDSSGLENPFAEGDIAAAAAGAGAEREAMTLSPGPQRRPTVHGPGPYTMSPGTSTTTGNATPVTPRFQRSLGVVPGSPGTASLERSGTPTSLGTLERGSRFTEEV